MAISSSRDRASRFLIIAPTARSSTTDAEELRLQVTVNVEDALVQIPQATPGVRSTNTNDSNGTTTVNLCELGDERTLVLVDGKRWIPAGKTGVADLNIIPVSLIRRVEVITIRTQIGYRFASPRKSDFPAAASGCGRTRSDRAGHRHQWPCGGETVQRL